MTASKNDIEMWYDEGKRKGATHMIVGLDTFDYDNFPIYVMPGQSVKARLKELTSGGNSYDEVYDFSLDRESQLRERRAVHIPEE